MQTIYYTGLDVHKETIAHRIKTVESIEISSFEQVIPGSMTASADFLCSPWRFLGACLSAICRAPA